MTKTSKTAELVLEPKQPDSKTITNLTAKLKKVDDETVRLAEILLNPRKPLHEKLKTIENEIKESSREVEFEYEIEGFFEDTCYALHRAVQNVQGFTKMKDVKTASGKNPPRMIDVRFSDGKRIKVPYGEIYLSAFGPNARINMQYDTNRHILHLSGLCQKKYTTFMDEIAEQTQQYVDTDSIYRNQAIRYDGNGSPEFMDLSNINKIELFLTEEAKYATEPIEVRITDAENCAKNGLDLKFGVLLEGNYGTGKTLYAGKLADKAIKNGWTFLYCKKPEKALQALQVANKFTKNGTGVVLFVEDIDKVLNVRDKKTNEISLLMDGTETKHNNLISIFSTNHIENIDPTFLRGKRIGSIVTLGHLDALTAEKMIHHYLQGILVGKCDKAAQLVEDNKIVPAFLQEIIDRVKTHSILRTEEKVTEKDIISAIKQFKRQMDIATVKVNKETDEELYVKYANKLHNKQILETLEQYPIIKGLEDLLIFDYGRLPENWRDKQ